MHSIKFVAELRGVERAELTIAEGDLKHFRASLELRLPDCRIVAERRFRDLHDLLGWLRSPDVEDSICVVTALDDSRRSVVRLLLDLAGRVEAGFDEELRRLHSIPGGAGHLHGG